TYTASQGLLLMIPNMYKIAGELLPGVIHVSARALSTHALSIFGDQSDVMACRQTGFALLAANSVQEAMDMGAVAHLSAIKSRVPFLHFFDGFRTSHEIQKIELLDYEDLRGLLDQDALDRFRKNALNPEHPVLRGSAQNPDIYFQLRESANPFFSAVPDIVEEYMNEISKLTGRDYKPFNYYGHPQADRVIIAMGSVCEAAEEVVDYLNSCNHKVGLIKVRLYRPFSVKHLMSVLPRSVSKIAVLDRTKEPGSLGEPLYLDVCSALFEAHSNIKVVGGRYGLGSKDTAPEHLMAVFENLNESRPRNHFTIGIVDDVSNLSLPKKPSLSLGDQETVSCKFWGLGSDGTVGANKNSIKIVGDNTDMYAQAYFSYDSKKSGGITQSHLRFGKNPIRCTYLIKSADFVACHKQEYVYQYDLLDDLVPGGIFLLNTEWTEEELSERLPAKMRKTLAEKKIRFYIINGVQIAHDIGLGNKINSVLQAAFFKLADVIPIDNAVTYMKTAIKKTYAKKGDDVLTMNYLAVDRGVMGVHQVEIPEEWINAEEEPAKEVKAPDFVKNIMMPMAALKGDDLPVSAFKGREDGTLPPGTAKYEKRGIAVEVPEWKSERCIQCNQCSYVCPHAAIRPFLITDEEVIDAPDSFATIDAELSTLEHYNFRIQVSPLDCVGCGTCVNICPTKVKSLEMKPMATQEHEKENWDYAIGLSVKPTATNIGTVRTSQFQTPLLEFSGACAG
ncbi:MAG: pyruvate:ferredoxin (flavodoxin) oxidoreductase, partial [Firmicutes bacterium]|nr:pyruvate:ferredoxin (flavodoxin) oxidoreductase [Bacillota bacterium]